MMTAPPLWQRLKAADRSIVLAAVERYEAAGLSRTVAIDFAAQYSRMQPHPRTVWRWLADGAAQ